MIEELIRDLEIDVACLLDCPEAVCVADLKFLQIKLARLYDEYILLSTQSRQCGTNAM